MVRSFDDFKNAANPNDCIVFHLIGNFVVPADAKVNFCAGAGGVCRPPPFC